MSDKQVLTVANEVEVTQEMVDLYAKRYRVDAVANRDGIVGSIAGWCNGKGELDAYLTDSPEGNPVFAPVRSAFFKANGFEEPALSNVSFEQVPEGTYGSETKAEEAGEAKVEEKTEEASAEEKPVEPQA